MRLLSPRLLIPVAAVVVAWGGVHLLTAHSVAITPAVWPVAAPTPSAGVRQPALTPVTPPTAPSASPSGGAGIPVLPGALQQLNGSTRDTAVGVYALIQQLEEALRTHIEQLIKQLEPGR